MEPLKFLAAAKLADLWERVPNHREQYSNLGFEEHLAESGWGIETANVRFDPDRLASLGEHVTNEIQASLTVYTAFEGMTPALARDERLWARLAHVECLGYARARWLKDRSDESLDAEVSRHLFARGLTGVRDDNAISRLWWNAHIAKIADPDDLDGALRLILKTADIRSNIVERANTVARPPLARAILRAMRRIDQITSTEASFREFMKVLNRDCGGILFEVMRDDEADEVLNRCADLALSHLADQPPDAPEADNSQPEA